MASTGRTIPCLLFALYFFSHVSLTRSTPLEEYQLGSMLIYFRKVLLHCISSPCRHVAPLAVNAPWPVCEMLGSYSEQQCQETSSRRFSSGDPAMGAHNCCLLREPDVMFQLRGLGAPSLIQSAVEPIHKSSTHWLGPWGKSNFFRSLQLKRKTHLPQ